MQWSDSIQGAVTGGIDSGKNNMHITHITNGNIVKSGGTLKGAQDHKTLSNQKTTHYSNSRK
jgi:hypothetical protein